MVLIKIIILGLYMLFAFAGGFVFANLHPPVKAQTIVVTPSPAPPPVTVPITQFQYNPVQITVSPTTTVTWVNQDSVDHTVTADDVNGLEFWDSGIIAPGRSYSKTFNKSGTFFYHCNMHPSMTHGSVVVTGTTPIVAVSQPSPAPVVVQLPRTGIPAFVLITAFTALMIPVGIKLSKYDKGKNPKASIGIYSKRQYQKNP